MAKLWQNYANAMGVITHVTTPTCTNIFHIQLSCQELYKQLNIICMKIKLKGFYSYATLN